MYLRKSSPDASKRLAIVSNEWNRKLADRPVRHKARTAPALPAPLKMSLHPATLSITPSPRPSSQGDDPGDQ